MAYISNIKVLSGNKLQLSGSQIEILGQLDASNISADTITAREYHTEFVSASVIYQSGSTKFGNSPDDIHQLTGSVVVSGSLQVVGGNITGQLDASNIVGTVSLNNGGTGADLSGTGTGADGYVMVREGTSLVAYQLTSSDGTVVISGDALTDKISLTVSPSVGTGTVTNITLGAGLENSGSSITTTGTIAVSASANGGINVASGGISVDSSTVVTTTATNPYTLNASLHSNETLSAATGSFDKLDLQGALKIPIRTVAVNSTVDTTDFVILADASSGEITLTLPPASSAPAGRKLVIKKIDSNTSNAVILDGDSSETIDGDLQQSLYGAYQSLVLVASGSGWYIL